MKTIRLVFLAAVLISVLACNSLGTPTPPKEHLYTVSGTLHPAREITMPKNTRVVVLWTVLSGETGYGYVFGEGTIDFLNYAFTIHFDEPPPIEAINQMGDLSFGYGRVILTANQKWHQKIPAESFTKKDIIGIVASDMIFYIDGNTDTLTDVSWMKDFGQGYNLAREVKNPSGSDSFAPASPNSLQMIIDDINNIEVANWW